MGRTPNAFVGAGVVQTGDAIRKGLNSKRWQNMLGKFKRIAASKKRNRVAPMRGDLSGGDHGGRSSCRRSIVGRGAQVGALPMQFAKKIMSALSSGVVYRDPKRSMLRATSGSLENGRWRVGQPIV